MSKNNNYQDIPNHELKREAGATASWSSSSSPARRAASLGERPMSTSSVEQEPEMRSVAFHKEHRLQRVDASGRPISHQPRSKSCHLSSSPTKLTALTPSPDFSASIVSNSSVSIHSSGDQGAQQQRRSWDVEHATLPSRPENFPLLPTSRIVHGMTAETISKCISDCLRVRSVKMTVSKSQANLARCLNTDFCRFNVRLYSTEYDDAVLVEVHRLTGDAMSFMRDCRAVFHAAEGGSKSSSTEGGTIMPPVVIEDNNNLMSSLPVSQMKFLGSLNLISPSPSPPPTTQEEYAEAFKSTSDLLSSHMSDSNMLGMESLVIQTDPNKTDRNSAVDISRRILSPPLSPVEEDVVDNPNRIAAANGFNLHTHLMSILLSNDGDAATATAGPKDLRRASEESETPSFESDHETKLRNLAMLALSNALELFSSENLLSSTIASDLEWYTSILIPTLMQDLTMANDNPHDACYASRCLSTLAKSSVTLANSMREQCGLLDAVKNAEMVGTREFAMLAQDARTCRESFGEVGV